MHSDTVGTVHGVCVCGLGRLIRLDWCVLWRGCRCLWRVGVVHLFSPHLLDGVRMIHCFRCNRRHMSIDSLYRCVVYHLYVLDGLSDCPGGILSVVML